MTTTTQTAQITLPTSELRQILAALDEYTTSDKTRQPLTLARVTPIIVAMDQADIDADNEPTALSWEATNSTELVSITQRVRHDLTEPALIDPAALLAALPKKADTSRTAETVLSLTPDAWQLTTGTTTSTGQRHETQWPNTFGLWKDQQDGLAPHSIGAPMLSRLAKLAKHLGTDQVNLASMAHTDGKPDPRRPLTYTITANNLDARVLIMPRRPN